MKNGNIKVPRKAVDSRVVRALSKVPRDGKWQRLLEMGFSSSEQTARSMNVPGGDFEYGYSHETKDGELISVLWARWTG